MFLPMYNPYGSLGYKVRTAKSSIKKLLIGDIKRIDSMDKNSINKFCIFLILTIFIYYIIYNKIFLQL